MNSADLSRITAIGNWAFSVVDRHQNVDYAIFPGDGTDDLDILLRWIDTHPRGTVSIDLGIHTSSWAPITRDEVVALRAAFVAKYGNVAKIPFP